MQNGPMALHTGHDTDLATQRCRNDLMKKFWQDTPKIWGPPLTEELTLSHGHFRTYFRTLSVSFVSRLSKTVAVERHQWWACQRLLVRLLLERTSILYNRRGWTMSCVCSTNLRKNERIALSQCDICLPCEIFFRFVFLRGNWWIICKKNTSSP